MVYQLCNDKPYTATNSIDPTFISSVIVTCHYYPITQCSIIATMYCIR